MENIRLQKYLAECGIASRRKCEELIESGKVMINGRIAVLGDKINPETDDIILNGKRIVNNEKKIYILLNKPIRICYNI